MDEKAKQDMQDMIAIYGNGLKFYMEPVPDLDPGIRRYVEILRRAAIATCQSCEGGQGHAYSEPTIDFEGNNTEGFRAYAWAIEHGLPVKELRRVWRHQGHELVGPLWSLVFWEKDDAQP